MILKYLLILLGLVFITFNREITDAYEDFAVNKSKSRIPKFITTKRLLISGLIMIGFGVYQLVVRV